eukprot:15290400-Alexandrium_andersonii.AAC.1
MGRGRGVVPPVCRMCPCGACWPALLAGVAVGVWCAWGVSAVPVSCASCSCLLLVGSVSVALCTSCAGALRHGSP